MYIHIQYIYIHIQYINIYILLNYMKGESQMYATLLAGFCDFAAPMVLIVRVNISPIRGVMIKK